MCLLASATHLFLTSYFLCMCVFFLCVCVQIKPSECKLISAGSGLFTAEQIASDILSAMKSWKFLVNTGMDGHLLALLSTGTSPAHSPLWAILELFSLGIIRVVSLVYRWSYNQICFKEYKKRQANSSGKKKN